MIVTAVTTTLAIALLACAPARAQEALLAYKSLKSRDCARACPRRARRLSAARLSGGGRGCRSLWRDPGRLARPLCRSAHAPDRGGQGVDRGQLSHQHHRPRRLGPAGNASGGRSRTPGRGHSRRRSNGASCRSLVGAIGASSAPGGDADDACAKALVSCAVWIDAGQEPDTQGARRHHAWQ